jgi:molecular chaperone GrpE
LLSTGWLSCKALDFLAHHGASSRSEPNVTTDNETTPTPPHDGPADGAPAQNGNGAEAAVTAAAPAEPSELDVLKAERDKTREQLVRTAADFDNFRKRTKRDLDDARARGKDDLIRDLLPVFDNLERAVQSGTGASDASSVLEGVRMVLKLFEDTIERVGLTRVPTVGARFDPAVHEALQQQETDAHPPGTVIHEIAAGYRSGERLVRPAMVIVARKPAEKPADKPAEPKPDAAEAKAAATSDTTTEAKAEADETE